MTQTRPRLEILGHVERPASLDFDALRELGSQIEDIGRVLPGRSGGGVALQAILDAAGCRPDASTLRLESSDGSFDAELSIDAAGEAMVAYRFEDEALPDRFGGPFRFFIPDAARCGEAEADHCKNVKQLGRITVR